MLSERRIDLNIGIHFEFFRTRLDVVHVVPGDARNKIVEAIVESDRVSYGVVAIYDKDQSMKERCLKLEIPFHTLGFRDKRLISQFFSLLIYVLRTRPKSLYLHSFYPSILGAGLTFFCPFTKMVSVRHHNMVYLLSKNLKGIYLDKFIARMSFRTIAVSNAVRETMLTQGCNAEKIAVIHNGIELYVSKHVPEPIDARVSKLRLLAIGRLDWQKNYETMLRLAAELKKRGFDFTLAILGTGNEEYASSLFGLCKSLELDSQVNWVGWDSDIERWFSESDIFLHTALDEACPLVIIEALSAGIPIVSSNSGGSSEVIAGFASGCDANDIEGYIEQIDAKWRNLYETKVQAINQIPLVQKKFGISPMRQAYEEHSLSLFA